MGKTVRNYRLQQVLGRGSFATVFRALNMNNNETVAVKEISRSKISDDRSKKHLDAEIRLLKEFSHPNIVRLLDNLASTNNIYLVFEFCGGGDLRVYIDKFGRLTEHTTRFFLLQLCDGLVYLNERHMIHRDLKPQNILLTEQGPRAILKIADFGFVKYVEEASVAATMCGTPLYMAPEIVDHFEYDAKVDMWSLGCILFEMLVGKTVFLGSTQAEVLSNVKAQDVVFPTNIAVSEQVIGLLQKLLRRNPASRCSHAELEAICGAWREEYSADLPRKTTSSAVATTAATDEDATDATGASAPRDPATEARPGMLEEIPEGDREESLSPDGKALGGGSPGDDASKTIKASYNQQPNQKRGRTVSLDTAKQILAYTQQTPAASEKTSHPTKSGVGVTSFRRQGQLPSAGSEAAPPSPHGPLTLQGLTSGNTGSDSKDEDSGWEIINHPPPISGIAAMQMQSGNSSSPQAVHIRRRSAGSADFISNVETPLTTRNYSQSRDGGGRQMESPLGDDSNHSHPSSTGPQGAPRAVMPSKPFMSVSKEDTLLLEWCKRLSTMIARVTVAIDGILVKAVSPARRQFLLKLTAEQIHELRLEMIVQQLKEIEIDEAASMSRRRKSAVGIKSQLSEFTALVDASYMYLHVIEYLRPCVAKTALLKGGPNVRYIKNSPTSYPPSSSGIASMQGQSSTNAAVERVLKHLTGLLDGLLKRYSSAVVCVNSIVALLEQDEARGGDPLRIGRCFEVLVDGVQLAGVPAPEVLIYGAAQRFGGDGYLKRNLGNYKQAIHSLETAQFLLDYILIHTRDTSDRINIEKFIRLLGEEIQHCRQAENT